MSKKTSIFQQVTNAPYGYTNSFKLFDAAKNSKDIIQRLRLQVKIPAHNGCVNSLCWNESGKLLLSGSDDKHLSITDAYSHLILSYIQTGHRSNIFSAKFLPGTSDHKVVSCSGDGVIIYSDLEVPETSIQNKFNCHYGTAYEIMTIPNDPNTFLSCGEDGMVRWFDLRTKMSCAKDNCKEDVLINCHCGVTALAINPITPYQLAIGCADSTVRLFDRRVLGTQATGSCTNKSSATIGTFSTPKFTHTTHRRRITSLGYSQNGQEMLVSYSSDFVYLFDVKNSFNKDPKVMSCHGNTIKKGDRSTSPSRPLMKRLRVRGDWSDTGPQARPESEFRGENNPRSLHANLMQRMSDVLTSMYNRSDRPQPNTSSVSQSEDSEMDESNESGAAGRDNNPSSENAEPGESPPVEEPVIPGAVVDIAVADSTMDEDDPAQKSPPSQVHFSEPGIEFSCTTIEINTPTTSTSGCTEALPASGEALNLSLQNLQNLKQEMALNTESSSLLNETQMTRSDVVAMLTSSSSKEPSDIAPPVNNHSPPASSSSEIRSEQSSHSQSESTDNDCDKQISSNVVLPSNPSTELSSASISLRESITQQLSQSDLCDSTTPELASPEEAIENVAGASNSESAREQNSNRRTRNMALVMEVAADAWDEDSDEDPRNSPQSPPTSTDRQRIPDIGDIFEISNEDESEEFFMQPDVIQRFIGHRNARTMIKESTFWGNNFIMSGSDCGHIFVWDKHTAELVMLMEADHHVVNCLQPHPFDPILASSGIDYDIKIWAPLQEEPFFDSEKAAEVMTRNKVMLEETKDTITVPASFMIRMLASINQITSGSGWRRVARQLRDEYRNRR